MGAQVRPASDTISSREGLIPLLPLIFEKLLGRPLDLAPWGVPMIRIAQSEESEDISLRVTVALSVHPPAADGLFEMATPLGPVTLRLEGLRDTALSEAPAKEVPLEEKPDDEQDAPRVLLLTLPSEWLSPRSLRA